MKRIEQLKAELVKCRKELEFIEGQLHNDAILDDMELSELTEDERDKLFDKNEKLITEVIVLETLLESQ